MRKGPHNPSPLTTPPLFAAVAWAGLDEWITRQEKTSWELLQLNISPSEPKQPGGAVPRKGIVVAALHKKDPDYYFHWVRDSSNVMRVVVEYEKARGGDPSRLHSRMRDFLVLSRDLQATPSPYGLGEPRFTVEGLPDTLPWSRPQYDGPALRALAIIRYLKDFEPPSELRVLALEVLRRDLDNVIQVWQQRGFDLWEELKAENYHTRLVQMAALVEGEPFFSTVENKRIQRLLSRRLAQHWDSRRKYYRSQLVIEKTDGYTKKQTDLDSAIVVAVIESGRLKGAHSVMDDKVQATVAELEKLFRESYPINQEVGLGLAYGRYSGDVYYGGNPWYLITAYYAQFYYRLARALSGEDFLITSHNTEFVQALWPSIPAKALKGTRILKRGSTDHKEFMAICIKKGDRILARIRSVTPVDGQFYEQFDKASGTPLSSRGIGWAHSAFIAASLERSQLFHK